MMVRRPGFEPGTSGVAGRAASGVMAMVYHSDGGLANTGISGKLILPDWTAFSKWLGKQVSPRTLRDYESYYHKLPQIIVVDQIPGLVKNKWYRNVLSKVIEYLWETGKLSTDTRERLKALVKRSLGVEERRKVKSREIALSEVLGALDFLRNRRWDYYIVYKIMYYSGARLEEACYFLRNINRFRVRVERPEPIGYVDLGNAVRVNVHWNRGKKRCEHLWLPKQLFFSLSRLDVNAKDVSDYAKKHNILRPKYMRKYHYQVLEDLVEDISLRNFMQNRYSKLTIGDTDYGKIIKRADKAYTDIVLPVLERNLNQ